MPATSRLSLDFKQTLFASSKKLGTEKFVKLATEILQGLICVLSEKNLNFLTRAICIPLLQWKYFLNSNL